MRHRHSRRRSVFDLHPMLNRPSTRTRSPHRPQDERGNGAGKHQSQLAGRRLVAAFAELPHDRDLLARRTTTFVINGTRPGAVDPTVGRSDGSQSLNHRTVARHANADLGVIGAQDPTMQRAQGDWPRRRPRQRTKSWPAASRIFPAAAAEYRCTPLTVNACPVDLRQRRRISLESCQHRFHSCNCPQSSVRQCSRCVWPPPPVASRQLIAARSSASRLGSPSCRG